MTNHKIVKTVIQKPYLPSKIKWRPPKLSELPRWPSHGRVGLDIESRDPELVKLGPGVRRGGYIVGISFAFNNQAWYLPLLHESGGNLNKDHVKAYLMDQAVAFRGEIVGANLQYDLDYLAEWGVKFHPSVRFRDVQIAAPLIYELHMSYSLDNIAGRLGLPLKDESELLEVGRLWGLGDDSKAIKRQMWKLPSYHVGAYAEYDAVLPLKILEIQERELKAQNLQEVWDLETDNLPVALAMRRRGVRIDKVQLQKIDDWATEVETEEVAKIRAITGIPVEFGDTQKNTLLSQALGEIGLECPLTPETRKPSIKADFLRGHPHPVTDALLRARQFAKLRTTFCKQVWEQLIGDRVHCTFNQVRTEKPGSEDLMGAAFGRWSSSNFNIQNQPIRHEEYGKLWRAIYVPDSGLKWVSSDFSSQEPRLAVHLATLMGYPGALTTSKKYWDNPMTDPHSATADMMFPKQWAHLGPYYASGSGEMFNKAKDLREKAKTMFLSYCYGKGKGTLCKELGFPTYMTSFVSKRTGQIIEYLKPGPEGQKMLDLFTSKIPFIPMLDKECQRRGEIRGYVITLSGRRCRFRMSNGEYLELRKGLNKVIQGSAGDQIKAALRDLHKAGIPTQLTVHDEVCFSSNSTDEMRQAGEIMMNAVQLKVPSRVDVEYGSSWGSLTNKVKL